MALVFLDVDGTLLPFGSMAADAPLAGLDPRFGPRLAALGCELIWATTWMERANETIAPLLGLPSMPVLEPLPPAVEDDYFGLHWKTRAVVARAAGRPFVWLDDEITGSDREWVQERHPGRALLLRVEPRCGLTGDDLDAVAAWLVGRGTR